MRIVLTMFFSVISTLALAYILYKHGSIDDFFRGYIIGGSVFFFHGIFWVIFKRNTKLK